MIKNKEIEKINPHWASKKGVKPIWGTYEDSKRNRRKTFHPGKYRAEEFDGKFRICYDGLVRKIHSKPKNKNFTRENIRQQFIIFFKYIE